MCRTRRARRCTTVRGESTIRPRLSLSCTKSAQSAHSVSKRRFFAGFVGQSVGRFSVAMAQNRPTAVALEENSHCPSERYRPSKTRRDGSVNDHRQPQPFSAALISSVGCGCSIALCAGHFQFLPPTVCLSNFVLEGQETAFDADNLGRGFSVECRIGRQLMKLAQFGFQGFDPLR